MTEPGTRTDETCPVCHAPAVVEWSKLPSPGGSGLASRQSAVRFTCSREGAGCAGLREYEIGVFFPDVVT
jgi:hypothetical protein